MGLGLDNILETIVSTIALIIGDLSDLLIDMLMGFLNFIPFMLLRQDPSMIFLILLALFTLFFYLKFIKSRQGDIYY